jgi:outer membrane protein, heavy metal efflux system
MQKARLYAGCKICGITLLLLLKPVAAQEKPWLETDGDSASKHLYPPQQVRDLINLARQHNFNLKAMQSDAEASHANGDHHAGWEAPDLGVEFYQAPISSFPNPLKDQQEVDYSIQQAFPWPGKLSSMAAPRHFQGEAVEQQITAEASRLSMEVTQAYARWVLAQSRLELNREALQEGEALWAASRSRYEAGQSIQAEVVQAESEIAALELQVETNESEVITARSDLRRDLALPKVASTEESTLFNTPLKLQPVLYERPLDSLKARAMCQRGDLESQRILVQMGEAEIESERKSIWPDIMVRGVYKNMLEDHQDDWSLMVGVKATVVPWNLSTWRSGIKQAQAQRNQSENQYRSLRLKIENEVESAYAQLQSVWRRLQIMENRRLPLSNRVLQSNLVAFAGGQATLSTALLAFRDARMARDEVLMARSEHLMAWAALTYALGCDPQQIGMAGEKP